MSKHIIDNILAERARAWEQAKAVLDGAEAEGRSLSVEENEKFDRINADIDRLDEQRSTVEAAEERAKAADEARAKYGAVEDKPEVAEKRAESDADIFRKMASGELRGFNFKPEHRDLSKLTAAAGANTVPTSFHNQLTEHMIESSAIRQTNVTVLTTGSGEAIQLPKTTAHSSASLISEGSAISESDPTFGQVTLDAFKYAILIQVSRELLQDSGVNLVDYLSRQAGRALGNKSGEHFVTGTGSSQPNGVVTAASSGVTGGTGVTGAFTGDELITLKHSVIPEYRRDAYWLMSDAAVAAARKLKGSDNNYLWQPGLQAGSPDMLLGHRVVVDTNVADPALSAKSVVFGDFSAYVIRDVAGVSVDVSTDFAFNTDLVTYRFLIRTDGDLVDTTGAIKFFTGGAS